MLFGMTRVLANHQANITYVDMHGGGGGALSDTYFEFTLPESQADYRLLVDALGKGRLGSQQQLLVGTKPAEAKPAAETAPAQPPAAPAADLKSK